MKKILAVVLTISMLAIALGGCGSTSQEQKGTADAASEGGAANAAESGEAGESKEAASQAGGKIVFAYWGAESENNAIQTAVNDFRGSHPEIEVDTQWIEADYLTKLQTQTAGETTADVYLISAGDLPGFASNFETQTVDSSKYLSENIIKALESDGELKARPFIIKPKVMAINKDIFKECGVEIPALDKPMTVDDFKHAIVALSRSDSESQRFGGSYYKNEGTASNLDSKEVIAAGSRSIPISAPGISLRWKR